MHIIPILMLDEQENEVQTHLVIAGNCVLFEAPFVQSVGVIHGPINSGSWIILWQGTEVPDVSTEDMIDSYVTEFMQREHK